MKDIIILNLIFRNFGSIKEQNSHKNLVVKTKKKSRLHFVLKQIGIAALTTVIFFMIMVYVNVGDFINFFSPGLFVELGAAFIFLLGLFWSHRKISAFMNSSSMANLPEVQKSVIELFILTVVTLVLSLALNFLPLLLFFPLEAFLPIRVRTAMVFSIIVSLFFYYFIERERGRKDLQKELLRSAQLQKENYQAQLQNLKNQINPHFLFNSLNVLGSLIYKNQEQAVEFLRNLSGIYHSFLENTQEELVPLQKELDLIESYNYLLITRFGDALQFQINIEEKLHSYYIPPGALQTLVENAVKHNGFTKKNPLVVKIFSSEEMIVVENNLKMRVQSTTSTKTGLKNLKNRYKFLSSKKPSFEKIENKYIAKLPLIKVEEK